MPIWVADPHTDKSVPLDHVPATDAEALPWVPDGGRGIYQDCRESGMSPWDSLNEATKYSNDGGISNIQDNAW